MIGIDITDINRFVVIQKNDFSSWQKVFTKSEWQYCFKKSRPAQHLAGIFAAKEAVIKALNLAATYRYNLIEIVHNKFGRPAIKIKSRNKTKLEISISHDTNLAVAVAIKIL